MIVECFVIFTWHVCVVLVSSVSVYNAVLCVCLTCILNVHTLSAVTFIMTRIQFVKMCVWNSLPLYLRRDINYEQFKLKTVLFES